MKKIFLFIISITASVAASAQAKTIIRFESNRNELDSYSLHLLDSISTLLKPLTDYQIIVNAYCDNTGKENDNQILSEKRMQAVINHFINENLNAAFISGKGFSANDPVASNMNEHGKAMNRRVEILITAKQTETPIVILPVIEEKEEPVKSNKPDVLSESSSLNDLEIGKILILKNLNFEGGTARLLPESKVSLKVLLKLMKDNPTIEIEIEGHVCCANDMPLSVDRALTVLEYLVNNGIKEKRLKYAGHSNYIPIASEQTEVGRIQNRRVEIMILKK